MDNNVKSVAKSLDIISLLLADESVTPQRVEAALGIPRSSAHRLLATLCDRGFLTKLDNRGTYGVGGALRHLSREIHARYAIDRIAYPHMRRLADEIDETIHLQILVGGDTVFVRSAVDGHKLRVVRTAGSTNKAYATAGGKLMLSFLDIERVHELYPTGLTASTKRTVTSMESLEKELAIIREKGYAINLSEADVGINAIAVPIIGDDQPEPIAVLSIAAPAARMPHRRMHALLPPLRHTARLVADDYGIE